jgi:hypothetical protein
MSSVVIAVCVSHLQDCFLSRRDYIAISKVALSSRTTDCVKTFSEPFDGAQGERISTQFLVRPHRSW